MLAPLKLKTAMDVFWLLPTLVFCWRLVKRSDQVTITESVTVAVV